MFPSLQRYNDWNLLLLRLVIGAIFLYHGIAKWQMEDPSTLMTILRYAEPLGGAALIAGVFSQLASLGLIIIMLGAIYMKATGFGQTDFNLFGTFGKGGG